jgi:hypothetical protein
VTIRTAKIREDPAEMGVEYVAIAEGIDVPTGGFGVAPEAPMDIQALALGAGNAQA